MPTTTVSGPRDRLVPNLGTVEPDLKLHSDLAIGSVENATFAELQAAAGTQLSKLDPASVAVAKSPTVIPSETARADTVGVVNPFAIVQLRLERKIDPSQENVPQLLEKTLNVPYEKLFDPRSHGLLYPGLTVDPRTNAVIRSAPLAADQYIHLLLGGTGGTDPTTWTDPGHFFTDAAQFTDPIQGGLADCYFIAALASVAWARPLMIGERTLPIGPGGDFPAPHAVDVISFFDSAGAHDVQSTELLPRVGGNYLYARADDPTELWPAIYEKAYVRWRTNDTSNAPTDRPNFPFINYGDTVGAAAVLTGLAPTYYPTHQIITIPFVNITFDLISPHQIWQTVRANSLSQKTINPMVAWTYGSAAQAPDPINYGNAHIVANHAYSILGWAYENNQEYIVLRNPWGNTEATLNVVGGTWTAYDGSYWRSTPLSTSGVFALRADTFKQYYAGFGVVR